MNVVDNLNSVQVINQPCMSSRNMRLLPWAAVIANTIGYINIYGKNINTVS